MRIGKKTMENCIPLDYQTYTNDSYPDTISFGIHLPGGKVGFKDSWLSDATSASTVIVSLKLQGQSVGSIEPQKLDSVAVGQQVYVEYSGACYSGEIEEVASGVEFEVNLNKISGEVVVQEPEEEEPVDEEPVDEVVDTPSEDETAVIDDNLDSSEGGQQATDVEFCTDKLLWYHREVKLQDKTPEQSSYDGQIEYIYTDETDDAEVGIDIRSKRQLKFVMWYNKAEYNTFKNEDSLPIERINRYVVFEKHLSDLLASNLNERTVFNLTKNNYGDDNILMQMDAETASLFGVDMGCYIIDFNADLDDYETSEFIDNAIAVDNSVNLAVIKTYNIPTPTPTLTPTPTPTATPTPTLTPTPTPTDTIGTYTEVPLVQSENGLRFFMGWYGVCGFNCRPYDLTATGVRSKIFRVFQINEQNDNYSIFNTSFDQRHDNFYQDFTELECGHPYLIVLEKGTGTLVIPGFVEAKKMSEDAGRVTLKCFVDHDEEVDEEQPIQECCDGLDTSTTTIVDEELGGYNIVLKNGVDGKGTIAGKLCWSELTGTSQLPTEYNCPFEVADGSKGAMLISMRYPLPSEGMLMRFESEDGACYETTITSAGGEANIFIKMSD